MNYWRGYKEIVPENVSRVHVTQSEALGLGHAILCAESVVGDEPFAILLADDMIRSQGRGALAQMVDVHDQTGASVIGVEEIPQEMTGSYGIVGVNHSGSNPSVDPSAGGLQEIHTIVEKPAPEDAPSRLGVVGRYVLSPHVFTCLRDVQAGAGGEIQLTDGIAAMLKSHKVLACPFSGVRYDCGSRQGFIKATIDYALDHHDLRDDMLEHMSGILVQYRGEKSQERAAKAETVVKIGVQIEVKFAGATMRVKDKRDYPAGTIVRFEHRSHVLADNPWGDPEVREVAVYLPHDYQESGEPFIALWDLAAYTNSGPGHLNWRNQGENLVERLDRLVAEGRNSLQRWW